MKDTQDIQDTADPDELGNAVGSTEPSVEDKAHWTPEMQKLADRDETAKTPIKITMTPAYDAETEAKRLIAAGGGETNDYDVLAWLVSLCHDQGLELNCVRHEVYKDGSPGEVHFDLEQTAIIVREQIEIRPGPYRYDPPRTSPGNRSKQ